MDSLGWKNVGLFSLLKGKSGPIMTRKSPHHLPTDTEGTESILILQRRASLKQRGPGRTPILLEHCEKYSSAGVET